MLHVQQAIILVSGSGEVSVLSIQSLSSLLSGDHVTGWSVTPASNEQFFLLEVSDCIRHLRYYYNHSGSLFVVVVIVFKRN